jgi:hypothetical protein
MSLPQRVPIRNAAVATGVEIRLRVCPLYARTPVSSNACANTQELCICTGHFHPVLLKGSKTPPTVKSNVGLDIELAPRPFCKKVT